MIDAWRERGDCKCTHTHTHLICAYALLREGFSLNISKDHETKQRENE